MRLRREFCGTCSLGIELLAGAAIGLLGQQAAAGTTVHLTRTVWGCVDWNAAATINDDRNPARSDPQWVARTSDEGQCVTISPKSPWEPLSPDRDGLTYLAYRGTVGKPGSFWVPTSAIDFDPPPEPLLAPVATTSLPAPQPTSVPESSAISDARTGPELTALPEAKGAAAEPPPTVAEQAPTGQPSASPPTASPPLASPVPSGAPQPTSTAAPSSEDDLGGCALAILALLAIAWLMRRSRRRKAKARRGASPVKARAKIPTMLFRIQPSSLAQVPARNTPGERSPASRVDGNPATTIVRAGNFRIEGRSINQGGSTGESRSHSPTWAWHPPGTSVTVAGATIMNGMVYVGTASGPSSAHSVSFIDPAVPVARTSASAGPLGYWPSYGGLTPDCRRRYLEWLASGKRDPDADLGYVFLYFYGIERRLLVEAPGPKEVQDLIAELKRLRTIYAGNRSFDGYSRRLVEAAAFLQEATAGEPRFVPDLAAPSGEMPPGLKVAIAREVVAGRPLGFEFAAAALFGLHEFVSAHRHVLETGRQAFLAVLRPRFRATFPSGFALRNRKDSHLQIDYRGATAGLGMDLVVRAGLRDLPDPATLTWTKLLALAGAIAEEVTPYAKTLAYHPARANSLAGLVGCPTELRDAVAPDARRWLQALPSPAAVPFGELARHAIGVASAKWTILHRRQVSEALSVLGYAVEPDPQDGAEHLEDDMPVQVFRCAHGDRSRATDVACAAAMLVTTVAKTADGGADKAAEFWLSSVPSRLSLTSDQTMRLRARLAWLATKDVPLAKPKRLLADAAPDEREFCAWSATVAAGAVGKPQVAMLEAIHDALRVPRAALYAGLHAGIGVATAAANEPVIVSEEIQETLHAIPRPPVAKPVHAEPDRLVQIRAETERVSAMLANIFVEDEVLEPVREDHLAGLDADHAALLTQLMSRPQWPRDEFEHAASMAGLMPGGAMEAINEWAFDCHGDALIEDGDPVVVNRALLRVDHETVGAQ